MSMRKLTLLRVVSPDSFVLSCHPTPSHSMPPHRPPPPQLTSPFGWSSAQVNAATERERHEKKAGERLKTKRLQCIGCREN
ncbi:hypothetical protein ACSQ67_022162 [Phaseolus vulgaris]